jgi:hypothetical protein
MQLHFVDCRNCVITREPGDARGGNQKKNRELAEKRVGREIFEACRHAENVFTSLEF